MRENWLETTLGDILTLEYGKALPASRRTGEGYPVFGSAGEVGRHSDFLVEGPGIIVGRKGTAGAVTWSDESFFPIDTTYWVKINSTELDLRYARILLEHLDLSSISEQSGVPGLNREKAYRLPVSLPSVAAQRRIAALVGHLDSLKEALSRELGTLEGSRRALLSVLVSGDHAIPASYDDLIRDGEVA